MEATLALNHGRAWAGFTSATGFNTWQVHDILEWNFQSLRQDKAYYPPPIVGGEGAFSCSGVAGSDCSNE